MFNNLCLSRKVKASDLPVVTLSPGSGSWVLGSFKVRQIALQQDEVLAACGRSQGEQYCPYAITYGLQGIGNGSPTIKPYLFAARKITPFIGPHTSWMWWNDSNTIDTGITDSSSVANDLYVYIFKRSTDLNLNTLDSNEKFGLQVFDGNGDALFDSRVKTMRVLYFGSSSYDIPSGKKIAIAPCSMDVMADGWIGDTPSFYVNGIVTRYNTTWGKMRTETGMLRSSIPGGFYSWIMPGGNQRISPYIVLDVTNY